MSKINFIVPENFDWTQNLTNNYENTIFEIRDDFDLNGITLTIPSGCTLKFEGGSFSNGTLNGDNTILKLNTNCIKSNLKFSGTFSQKDYIDLSCFEGTYDGLNNNINQMLQASNLSHCVDNPNFILPKNIRISNPITYDGTLSTINSMFEYVISWGNNTKIKPKEEVINIKFNCHDVPLFFIGNSINVDITGVNFTFEGVYNPPLGGSGNNFLNHFNLPTRSIFQNTYLNSVILYLDSNNIKLSNLKFSHTNPNAISNFIFFCINGHGKYVDLSGGVSKTSVVDSYISNINFKDYQFGFFGSSQKIIGNNWNSSNRIQHENTPGHILYLIGSESPSFSTDFNTECSISGIYEDDIYDTNPAHDNSYIGTLAIKYCKDSFFKDVHSKCPEGLLHSLDNVHNCTFENFSWESGDRDLRIPVLNIATSKTTNGFTNNTFKNFIINFKEKSETLIEYSTAQQEYIYNNIFNNFLISTRSFAIDKDGNNKDTTLINDRGSNNYTNFNIVVTSNDIPVAPDGNPINTTKIYNSTSLDSWKNSFVDISVIGGNTKFVSKPKCKGSIKNLDVNQSIMSGDLSPYSYSLHATDFGATFIKQDESTENYEKYTKITPPGASIKFRRWLHDGDIRSGAFTNKPTISDDSIVVGYQYFCTDRQTPESLSNGIVLYHKGTDIWVDALGRVVS